MRITVLVTDEGAPGETEVLIVNIKKAGSLPAIQLQDGLAQLGASLLEGIINVAAAKQIFDAEQMDKITLADITPDRLSIKVTPAPGEANTKIVN